MSVRNDLQEQAYRELRKQIMAGTFVPGQKLSEPELAAMFQVSRSPIREAMLRLERDGFLVRGRNGRVSVAPLDIEEMRHLYVVRANLEGLATRLATSFLRTVDLEVMDEALRANRQAVTEGNANGASLSGQAFHNVILRECGNAPLRDVLTHFSSRINRFRMLAQSFETYDEARLDEHQRVLDALYARDPDVAEAAMVFHIQQSGEALLANLRSILARQETAMESG